MPKFKLLTVQADAKTVKGERAGYITAVLYLAPSDLSGVNLCAMAKLADCEIPCLNVSGRGEMAAGGNLTHEMLRSGTRTNTVQLARLRKAKLFNDRPSYFMLILAQDIAKFVHYARKLGLIPCIRLNGTSDIRWEDIATYNWWPAATVDHIFGHFPTVQFYDYTKLPNRRRALGIPNYKLTFSYSHAPAFAPIVVKALQTYGNAVNFAAVFAGKKLPEFFLGRRVINADSSDLLFLDEPGVVCGLTAKGTAKKNPTSFVVPA